MEKFLSDEEIRQYVSGMSKTEIHKILSHAPLAQLIEWQKMLEGSRDALAISNMKGCFVQSGVRIPARILNDDSSTLMFIFLLTERLTTRQ